MDSLQRLYWLVFREAPRRLQKVGGLFQRAKTRAAEYASLALEAFEISQMCKGGCREVDTGQVVVRFGEEVVEVGKKDGFAVTPVAVFKKGGAVDLQEDLDVDHAMRSLISLRAVIEKISQFRPPCSYGVRRGVVGIYYSPVAVRAWKMGGWLFEREPLFEYNPPLIRTRFDVDLQALHRVITDGMGRADEICALEETARRYLTPVPIYLRHGDLEIDASQRHLEVTYQEGALVSYDDSGIEVIRLDAFEIVGKYLDTAKQFAAAAYLLGRGELPKREAAVGCVKRLTTWCPSTGWHCRLFVELSCLPTKEEIIQAVAKAYGGASK